ncbi:MULTISPECIES: hypothetical protein [Mycolicibacterium]|uniref:hypothetical protein n=1 Tax=Mycolicibacterium TaxID=1866885 RepID=UPI0020CE7CAE|nr:hypothetical protein [Mycolicibacterium sp. PAM1]
MTSAHGQQPSYPPGFAPYPFPPAPRPPVSGVTAFVAAVLAGLGALWCLSGGVLGILDVAGLDALQAASRVETSVGIAGGLGPVLVLGILLNAVAAGSCWAPGRCCWPGAGSPGAAWWSVGPRSRSAEVCSASGTSRPPRTDLSAPTASRFSA